MILVQCSETLQKYFHIRGILDSFMTLILFLYSTSSVTFHCFCNTNSEGWTLIQVILVLKEMYSYYSLRSDHQPPGPPPSYNQTQHLLGLIRELNHTCKHTLCVLTGNSQTLSKVKTSPHPPPGFFWHLLQLALFRKCVKSIQRVGVPHF